MGAPQWPVRQWRVLDCLNSPKHHDHKRFCTERESALTGVASDLSSPGEVESPHFGSSVAPDLGQTGRKWTGGMSTPILPTTASGCGWPIVTAGLDKEQLVPTWKAHQARQAIELSAGRTVTDAEWAALRTRLLEFAGILRAWERTTTAPRRGNFEVLCQRKP